MNAWLLVMCLAVQSPPGDGTNTPGRRSEAPSRVVRLGGAKLVVVFLPQQGQEGIGPDEMAKRQVRRLALHRTFEKVAAALRDEGVEVVETEAAPVELVSSDGAPLLQLFLGPGGEGVAAVMDPQSEQGRQDLQGEHGRQKLGQVFQWYDEVTAPDELVKRARRFFEQPSKAN